MFAREVIPAPSIVCCGYPIVWEFLEEVWLGSCWRCRREFICSDPPPGGPRSFHQVAM